MDETELLRELKELFPERYDLHALAQRSDRTSRKELSVTMSFCLRQTVSILRLHLREDPLVMNVILVRLRHRVGSSMAFRSLVDAIASCALWDPTSRIREHAEAVPEVIEEIRNLGIAHPGSAKQVDLICFMLRIVQVAEASTRRHYSGPPSQLA